MNSEELIRKIIAAFSDVKLEDGIGLYEAQAIDDYESKSVRESNRLKDERKDWNSINPTELQYCNSSLSFFDAKGMKFHLPAFLIHSILGEIDDPLFHLVYNEEHSTKKLELLDEMQVKVVVDYLEWCLEQDEYSFEHPQIGLSLLEYWLPKSNN